MPRWMRKNSWAVLVATAVVLCSLGGCDRSDLSGYHPANKHTQNAASSADSKGEEGPNTASVVTGASSPIAAEDTGNSTAVPVKSSEPDLEDVPVSALVPVNVVDGNNVRALMNNIPGNELKTAADAAGSNQPAADVKTGMAVDAPRKIEVLVKEKTFRPEPKTGALRVSFDDLDLLKVLNMEPVVENAKELMPAWLLGLEGKTIRIRGYMYPTYDTEGIEHFVLARDNQICCFGRDPKIYDLVQVDMKPGKTTNYIPATRAFDVIGKFKIDLLADDGKPYGLYVIEQADVADH